MEKADVIYRLSSAEYSIGYAQGVLSAKGDDSEAEQMLDEVAVTLEEFASLIMHYIDLNTSVEDIDIKEI